MPTEEFAKQVMSMVDKMQEIGKPGMFAIRMENGVFVSLMPQMTLAELSDIMVRTIRGAMPEKKIAVAFTKDLLETVKSSKLKSALKD